MKTANEIIPIVKGQGLYLYDNEGKKYMDVVSSWWV
jgi:adenosylmethionine-8-amino-7-oxononanoate aminotransferase